MLTKVVRTAFIFAISLGIVLIFWGKGVLSIFGEEFIAAHSALIALVIGRLAHVAFGPGPLLLSMTGHERTVATIMVLAVLGNIAANLILIPIFGILGAAVVSASTIIVLRGGLSMFALKKTGLRVTLFG
jgi:O-antigen/teichoic acid export membrane protein